jgi:sulfate adenylyltransferase subunit 2
MNSIVNQPESVLVDSETLSERMTHLRQLEAESIYILREVAESFERPVLLYSIGKDSSVMLHLARKAFFPDKPPFPLLHIDSTWEFREMIEFRESYVRRELGLDLIVHLNEEGVRDGVNPFDFSSPVYTDIMRTQPLKQALDKYQFDAAIGGGRRDEERSRAKERIFSFRDQQHRWDPKNQRPELWDLYNTWVHRSQSIRVFPLSNWTELDVWQYIELESIPIVPLYFSKSRPIVERDGNLIMVDDERMRLAENENPELKKVRFRTLGCYPVTGAAVSQATNVLEIVHELLTTRLSERQGRTIDRDENAAMERKKREGYF